MRNGRRNISAWFPRRHNPTRTLAGLALCRSISPSSSKFRVKYLHLAYSPLFDGCVACSRDCRLTNSPRDFLSSWYACSRAGMSSLVVPRGIKHPMAAASSSAIPAPCPRVGKVACAASPRRAVRPLIQVGRSGSARSCHRRIGCSASSRNFKYRG